MKNPAGPAIHLLSATFLSRDALRAHGLTRSQISAAVNDGRLLRLRRGRYVRGDAPAELVAAGRLGGRLDCVSLLSALGVFVRRDHPLHLQFEPGSTRLPERPKGTAAHWRCTDRRSDHLAADLIEALAQACRCQTPRDAIATLDSAWHEGLIGESGIAAVFALLPQRYQSLRPLLDPRSESGSETIMRLLLRSLGAAVQVQVVLHTVGRVDFIVDGWLIVECDSRQHHEGWETQKRDRRRDIAAAALGYTTIRPIAEDILYRTDEVREALRAVLTLRPAAPARTNSTEAAATRRRRAAKPG